jgi:hypothetical protein
MTTSVLSAAAALAFIVVAIITGGDGRHHQGMRNRAAF